MYSLENTKDYMKSFFCQKEMIYDMKNQNKSLEDIHAKIIEIVTESNAKAMNTLKMKNIKMAIKLLKKTTGLLKEFECKKLVVYQSLTYNNLSFAHKKFGNLSKALEILKNAAAISIQYGQTDNLAITYLNISAILKNMKCYKPSFDSAVKAVMQCQEDLIRLKTEFIPNKELISIKTTHMATAYNYMGLNEEALGNYSSALEWYKKACNTMESDYGVDPIIRFKFYEKLVNCAKYVDDLKKNQRVLSQRLKETMTVKKRELSMSKEKNKRYPDPIFSKTHIIKSSLESTSHSKMNINTKRKSKKKMKRQSENISGVKYHNGNFYRYIHTNNFFKKTKLEIPKDESASIKNKKSMTVFSNIAPTHSNSNESDSDIAYENNNLEKVQLFNISNKYNRVHVYKNSNIEKNDLEEEKKQPSISESINWKEEFDFAYKEIYSQRKPEAYVILRGSKMNKLADIRLIQIQPHKLIFNLTKEVNNTNSLNEYVIKNIWQTIKKLKNESIEEDARCYFIELEQYGKSKSIIIKKIEKNNEKTTKIKGHPIVKRKLKQAPKNTKKNLEFPEEGPRNENYSKNMEDISNNEFSSKDNSKNIIEHCNNKQNLKYKKSYSNNNDKNDFDRMKDIKKTDVEKIKNVSDNEKSKVTENIKDNSISLNNNNEKSKDEDKLYIENENPIVERNSKPKPPFNSKVINDKSQSEKYNSEENKGDSIDNKTPTIQKNGELITQKVENLDNKELLKEIGRAHV